MTKLMNKINEYGSLLDSLDLSPFETLNALSLRSTLQQEIDKMTNQEKLKMYQYDLWLLDNIKAVKEQLDQVYDFSKSNKPSNQWWWHLDKIISEKIVVKGDLFVETDVAL